MSEQPHRLESNNTQPGGLYIRPKTNKSAVDDDASRPKFSLLGLDRLAAQKRAEREAEDASMSGNDAKRVRLSSTSASEWDDAAKEPVFKKPAPVGGNYRPSGTARRMDTPSAPGGVSEAAKDRMWEHEREKKAGFRAGGLVQRSSRDGSVSSNGSASSLEPNERSKGPVSSLRRSEWDETPGVSSGGSPTLVGGSSTPRREWPGTNRSTGLTKGRSEWEATPRVQPAGYGADDPRSHLPDEFIPDDDEYRRWESEQNQVDRDWYDIEEDGGAIDETHNPFAELEDFAKLRETEMAKAQVVGSDS